jgi:hypothetical protein
MLIPSTVIVSIGAHLSRCTFTSRISGLARLMNEQTNAPAVQDQERDERRVTETEGMYIDEGTEVEEICRTGNEGKSTIFTIINAYPGLK